MRLVQGRGLCIFGSLQNPSQGATVRQNHREGSTYRCLSRRVINTKKQGHQQNTLVCATVSMPTKRARFRFRRLKREYSCEARAPPSRPLKSHRQQPQQTTVYILAVVARQPFHSSRGDARSFPGGQTKPNPLWPTRKLAPKAPPATKGARRQLVYNFWA